MPEIPDEAVHACPTHAAGLTPCCDKTPSELPRTGRMTEDPSLVTCPGCLACSNLDYGSCTCREDCGHLCCTGPWRDVPPEVPREARKDEGS